MTRAVRVLAAGLLVIAAAAAGIGWLYLVRGSPTLAGGPRIAQALPLEHLARQDAQPVLRLALIWLAIGGATGIGLALLGVRRAGVWAGVAVLLVLGLTGAASDAVQETQHIGPHLAPQLGRGATWLAAALVAAGAACARRTVP